MATQNEIPHHIRKVREHEERWQLLNHIVSLTRMPMTILSSIWIALVIMKLVAGLPHFLQWLDVVIWGLFILDFIIEVIIAPHKMTYIRAHWLTLTSLILPAFSALRILRAFQIVRALIASGSFSLLGIITATNRGMVAARRVVGRHGHDHHGIRLLAAHLAGPDPLLAPGALRLRNLWLHHRHNRELLCR